MLQVAKLEHLEELVEVHPEVSFWAMTEHEVGFSKHTWNGHYHRRALLQSAGILLPSGLLDGFAGLAGADDVLDAAAAAWSAARYARGEAKSLPGEARPGERQVIWY